MFVASDEATMENVQISSPAKSLRRSTKALGHRERRADFTIEQRNEPFLLLCGRPIACEDLCNQYSQ